MNVEDNASMLDKLRSENAKLKAMASEGGAFDVAKELEACHDEIKVLFERMDKDSSGSVSHHEFIDFISHEAAKEGGRACSVPTHHGGSKSCQTFQTTNDWHAQMCRC